MALGPGRLSTLRAESSSRYGTGYMQHRSTYASLALSPFFRIDPYPSVSLSLRTFSSSHQLRHTPRSTCLTLLAPRYLYLRLLLPPHRLGPYLPTSLLPSPLPLPCAIPTPYSNFPTSHRPLLDAAGNNHTYLSPSDVVSSFHNPSMDTSFAPNSSTRRVGTGRRIQRGLGDADSLMFGRGKWDGRMNELRWDNCVPHPDECRSCSVDVTRRISLHLSPSIEGVVSSHPTRTFSPIPDHIPYIRRTRRFEGPSTV
ncbi:hypothetical protein R3P38DRAFT_3227202 [Favolaschia claudopus]|uniref:Uncharacterized protein n=1 Tax=Favolaschia claudopus TaxID=2862362 RepID=A0AAV9ZSM0_9AGAR